MLPILETLYQSRPSDPARLHMLLVTLLAITQDPIFVRNAHKKQVTHKAEFLLLDNFTL